MTSASVFVCALLVASAAASSVPVSQRGRGAKIDSSSSGSFFSGGFQPSVAVPERRSDNYQAASTTSYHTADTSDYQTKSAGSDVASYHTKSTAPASPRFFGLESLFYGLQANWPGVLIAVVLVIGTIIIVPWIASRLLGSGSNSFLNLGGFGRSEDGGELDSLTSLVEEALKKHDVDAAACMQLGVCSSVRKAALDVVEGRADTTDLIVDGLSSNPLVTSWLDGTAILEASNAGRSGADCARTFGKCSLDVASWVAAIQ